MEEKEKSSVLDQDKKIEERLEKEQEQYWLQIRHVEKFIAWIAGIWLVGSGYFYHETIKAWKETVYYGCHVSLEIILHIVFTGFVMLIVHRLQVVSDMYHDLLDFNDLVNIAISKKSRNSRLRESLPFKFSLQLIFLVGLTVDIVAIWMICCCRVTCCAMQPYIYK